MRTLSFIFLVFFHGILFSTENRLSIPAFNRETLSGSIQDFTLATVDFIEKGNGSIIPLKDKKNLRQVSQQYQEYYAQSKYFQKLSKLYEDGCKLDKSCFLLDRIYKGTPEDVQFLLDIGTKDGISFLTRSYDSTVVGLTGSMVAAHRNDSSISAVVSAKESHHQQKKELNIDLCIASCAGNIQEFKHFYQTGDAEKNKESIPLVIWAATKNCDIKFLNHLKQYKEYREYMLRLSYKFLQAALWNGYEWEKITIVPVEHFRKAKKLIKANCFSLSTRTSAYDCQFSRGLRAIDYFRQMYDIYKDYPCGQYFKIIHWLSAEQYCREQGIPIEDYILSNRREYEAEDILGDVEIEAGEELNLEWRFIPNSRNMLLGTVIGLGSIMLLYCYHKYNCSESLS